MTDRAIGVMHEDPRVEWHRWRALLLLPPILALTYPFMLEGFHASVSAILSGASGSPQALGSDSCRDRCQPRGGARADLQTGQSLFAYAIRAGSPCRSAAPKVLGEARSSWIAAAA